MRPRALHSRYEFLRTDVAALARGEGRSIEDAGREARYRFLEEVAPEGALIATAHTADDAAETVLLNLLRGKRPGRRAWDPGRGGAASCGPSFAERRATLRGPLDAAGIGYRLDPSNEDPAFLRNRVRNEVLPLLESIRPGAADRIGQFSRLAADDEGLLDELARRSCCGETTPDGIDWREPPEAALGRRMLRLAIGEPGAERGTRRGADGGGGRRAGWRDDRAGRRPRRIGQGAAYPDLDLI